LFLRGPLTPGEINSSSGRLYEFDDLSEVQQVLEKLSSDAQPFLKLLPRQPGQKEARYLHLFADETMLETYLNESTSHSNSNTTSNLEERLRIVEEELAALKTSFEKLMKEWIG